jgi:hypothetical protein
MYYFDLSYLSVADHARLEQLKRIEESTSFTREERQQAAKDRAEIEKKRKPLNETNMEEAHEFRVFLFQKYRKLVGIGASQQAVQFNQFIQRVEHWIMTLQMDAAKKAMAEEKNKVAIGKGLRQHGRVQPSRGPVSTGPARNPWAIPTDQDN